MTTVFNCAGVDKKEFEKYTESHPATYDDWSRTWQQETTGKSLFKGQQKNFDMSKQFIYCCNHT